MPPTYEPLGQDAPDDDFRGESSSRPATSTVYPPKPETYYGDGPFDPPSSDDESEVLLEKGGPRSPGVIEEEGDLVVGNGSRKVRSAITIPSVPLSNATLSLFEEAASISKMAYHLPRLSHFSRRPHRHLRREILHRHRLPHTGRATPHYGPHI